MDIMCNIKNCRKPITSTAWITSCEHIFCPEHGQIEFELKYKNQDALKCPACSIALVERFDVVKSNLNPQESYKSVILSGLEPNVIIDIATRAINFWVNQMEEETEYHRSIGRIALEKIHNLQQHSKLHQLQFNANVELQNKKNKIKDIEMKYKKQKKTMAADQKQNDVLEEDFENAQQKKFEKESLKRNTENLNYIEDLLNNRLQTPKRFRIVTPESSPNTSTDNQSVSSLKYKLDAVLNKHKKLMADKNEDEFTFNPIYETSP